MSSSRGKKWWAVLVLPVMVLGVTVALATPAAAAAAR
jgi:hypothetical protein